MGLYYGLRGLAGISGLVIVVIAWILLQWLIEDLVTPHQNTSLVCQIGHLNLLPEGCVRSRLVLLR